MAKTKSAGRARQGTPRKGKRLGIKIFGGGTIKKGQIIVRQRGSSFFSGKGTKIGRDFTVYSVQDGKVNFRLVAGKRIVEVLV